MQSRPEKRSGSACFCTSVGLTYPTSSTLQQQHEIAMLAITIKKAFPIFKFNCTQFIQSTDSLPAQYMFGNVAFADFSESGGGLLGIEFDG